MNDLISRQAAIGRAVEIPLFGKPVKLVAVSELEALPPAEPERKAGEWNWAGFNIECSECGFMPNFYSAEPLYNFCPNCGARMEGK